MAVGGWELLPESRFPKLISLLDKGQRVQPDILGAAIRVEFENIAKARQLGISWNEIAEALGFPGKGKLASASYSRERRQAKKEKEVVPEKKKEAMPDAKAKTQKESTIFRSEDKAKGGRIGPPKPIGRGRLDLGENTPDDEL